MQALYFILDTLIKLYILTFMLRIILQWVRADFYNPISQFIVRVTNPVVVPFRRVIPSIGRLDTGTLVAAILLRVGATALLWFLFRGGVPGAERLIVGSVLGLVILVIQIYSFSILILVVLSWINPGAHNPITAVLTRIAEPLLRPARRVIPPVGGLDLSPLFVLIGLQAIVILLRTSIPAAYLTV